MTGIAFLKVTIFVPAEELENMPDHKISLDILNVVSPGDPRSRRPSLIARLTARLHADKYDRLLSVGVTPEPGSALAAHHARLTSTAERYAIAHSLRQVLCDAHDHRAPRSPRIAVSIQNVTAATHLIDLVTLRLHSPKPVGALGMARLRLVLSDGAGPLYRHGRGDLPGRLGAALAEL